MPFGFFCPINLFLCRRRRPTTAFEKDQNWWWESLKPLVLSSRNNHIICYAFTRQLRVSGTPSIYIRWNAARRTCPTPTSCRPPSRATSAKAVAPPTAPTPPIYCPHTHPTCPRVSLHSGSAPCLPTGCPLTTATASCHTRVSKCLLSCIEVA